MPHKLQRGWPLLLLLLVIPGTTFLFLYGLPMTHDGATHLLRIARLDAAIRAGFLFPRWLPDLILGHGYPVLNYYAAGTYYLVEGFHLLGLNLYYAFIVAQVALVYLAAVGIYLFARDLFGKNGTLPALVTTVAYVYAPYLLINIYVRGAIAELGAQMLLPWILWSFRRIWRAPEPQRYVPVAIFALGGLAWTHTISLLIIPPLLLAYLALLLSQATDVPKRIGWSVAAGGGAMGISAFYWLPLLVERQYISDVGFAISRTLMLPISFIDWGNFIDTALFYTFPEDPPFRFGLVQVIGTLIGLGLLWRKGRELWFWAGVLLFCLLMMTEFTRPIWFSNDLLPIIQFPWRLQAAMQVPVALLFGLPLTMLRLRWWRAALAVAVIILLVRVHLPHLPWAYLLSDESTFSMAQNAYFEAERTYVVKSSQMTTTVQEFRPKWADQTLTLDPQSIPAQEGTVTTAPPGADLSSTATQLQLVAADPFRYQVKTAGDSPFPLRFAGYFFPGWTATLDQRTALTPYPSTNLGLLTVDVPAGEHTLTVAWTGTTIAFVGGLLSQISLLGIGLWQLSRGRYRRSRVGYWGSAVPLLSLTFGLVATYWQPPLAEIRPHNSMRLPGLELMGYQQPTLTQDGIRVPLYWLVTETSPTPLAVRWQLQNEEQGVVAETVSAPFYDAYTTEQWVRNTVVDDAYLIPVPNTAPPGRYSLVMTPVNPQTERTERTAMAQPMMVGTVILPRGPIAREPQHAADAYYENQIRLLGYDARIVEQGFGATPSLPEHSDILVATAGKTLDYRLYWRTAQESNEPYVSFLHLTNYLGQPIAQYDHLPGPLFQPPALWATYNRYRDKFIVALPGDAESGLYWPNVGMYNWKDESRIPVHTATGEEIGDHIKLPPVKVVNTYIRNQGMAVNAQFGSLATLVSVDIPGQTVDQKTDEVRVKSGSTLVLTAYYRAETGSSQPLRRFAQLRNASDQILAQADGEPQNGVNPTWSWLPGEIVQETFELQIPDVIANGSYPLFFGFYNPTGNFERLPVYDADGTALDNGELPLLRVNVTAGNAS